MRPSSRKPSRTVYLYHLDADGHGQTGVAACYSLAEYDRDVIKKHERTRKDKEDDRTRHMVELRAQTGPVFLAHRPNAQVDELSRAHTVDRRVRSSISRRSTACAMRSGRSSRGSCRRSSRRSRPWTRFTSQTGIIARRARRERAMPSAIRMKRITFLPLRSLPISSGFFRTTASSAISRE